MALWNVDLDVYWQGMYSNGDPARMVVVLEAACAGVDLETGPFPVKAIPLEAALAEMEALRTEVLSDRL